MLFNRILHKNVIPGNGSNNLSLGQSPWKFVSEFLLSISALCYSLLILVKDGMWYSIYYVCATTSKAKILNLSNELIELKLRHLSTSCTSFLQLHTLLMKYSPSISSPSSLHWLNGPIWFAPSWTSCHALMKHGVVFFRMAYPIYSINDGDDCLSVQRCITLALLLFSEITWPGLDDDVGNITCH